MTASGPISIPLSRMEAFLSASSSFQNFVDANNATEALSSIYWFREDGGSDPCCLLSCFTNRNMKETDTSYISDRIVLLEIQRNTVGTDHEADAENFCNSIGGIESDLKTSFNDYSSGGLAVTEIDGPDVIYIPEDEEEEERWLAVMAVHCKAT